jgi:hypothetical protein
VLIRLRLPAQGPAWLPDFASSIVQWLSRRIQAESFTVATVPDATTSTGVIILVTNEAGGAVIAFSDGTNWRRVTDRAVIS